MAFIIPNEGELYSLSATFMSGGQSMAIKLYQNNATMTANMMASSFTEVTGGGYSAATALASAWGNLSTSAGSGQITAGPYTFSFTAAPVTTAYGYFITTPTSKCIAAESFSDGPYYLNNAGDTVRITATMRHASQTTN